MNIQCNSCGKSLQVDAKQAGQRVKCPCGAVLAVPNLGPAVASAAASAGRPAVAGAARPEAAPTATSKQTPSPAASAFGVDRAQVSSLFGELTANDMVVKGLSSDPKPGKKKKDPLAAYQPATGKGTPRKATKESAANASAAKGPAANVSTAKGPAKRSAAAMVTAVIGILMMVGAVGWFIAGYASGGITFYPAILLVLGLIATVTGLLRKR